MKINWKKEAKKISEMDNVSLSMRLKKNLEWIEIMGNNNYETDEFVKWNELINTELSKRIITEEDTNKIKFQEIIENIMEDKLTNLIWRGQE